MERTAAPSARTFWGLTPVLAAAALAFLLGSFLLQRVHEPWRDEAQAWLIAREVGSLREFVSVMGYEGSPGLWHLLLLPLAKAGVPYGGMFALHVLLAWVAVLILFRWGPFPTAVKLGLAGSYLLLFEYNVVARSYVLVVLLLFAMAAVYPRRFERPLLYGGLVGLLANTSGHGLVLAGLAGALYLVEVLGGGKWRDTRRVPLGLGLMLLGGYLALRQLRTPSDLAPNLAYWYTEVDIKRIGWLQGTALEAFLPAPRAVDAFWNDSWVTSVLQPEGPMAMMAGGLAVLAVAAASLLRHRGALLYFLAVVGALEALFYVKYWGSVRHHGLIAVAFLFALWVARSDAPGSGLGAAPVPLFRFVDRARIPRIASLLLVGVLVVQVVGAAIAIEGEVRQPFSQAEATAAFLREQGYASEEVLVAAYPSPHTSAILPFLAPERSTFYYLENRANLSYVTWDWEYAANSGLNYNEIRARLNALVASNPNRTVVFVTVFSLDYPSFLANWERKGSFEGSIAPGESYWVYERRPETLV